MMLSMWALLPPRRAASRVEVDDEFRLAHLAERLGAVTVFERDENHVRRADAVGVDLRALVVESGMRPSAVSPFTSSRRVRGGSRRWPRCAPRSG